MIDQHSARAGGLTPIGAPGKRRRQGFAEKGIKNVSGAMEHLLVSEDVARTDGFLQRLDPRAKLVGTLVLLVSIGFAHNPLVLMGFYLSSLALTIASRVPLKFFVMRVWLLVALFTGLVTLPAIFNFITPGDTLVSLLDLGTPMDVVFFHLPSQITVTYQGLNGVTLLMLRVASSVSIATLLAITTPWAKLLKGLTVLRIPRTIIFVLSMTHRYIFLLLRLVDSMFLSLESRRVGKMSSNDARRWSSASIGSLMGKSYELSNNVYLAMVSRGFRGNIAMTDSLQTGLVDWVWLFACCLCLATVTLVEQQAIRW